MDKFETIYTESSAYLAAHNHDATFYTRTEAEALFWYAGNDGTGSGSDADLIYKASGNLHAASFAGLGIPAGLVILWYGSVGSIPSGWHICDGNAGTVNLTDRFSIGSGAGATHSPGSTGGSTTFIATGAIIVNAHTLSIAEMASHRHPFNDKYSEHSDGMAWYGGSEECTDPTAYSGTTSAAGGGQGHGHSTAEGTSFSGDAVACMPYYYALCYIQKI